MTNMEQNTVEIHQIDRRYEHLRISSENENGVVLASVAQQGVLNPIHGIWKEDVFIIIDGFKRLRACQKLSLHYLPFKALADNEEMALLNFLQSSNQRGLHILEEAKIIKELSEVHQLTYREIGGRLNKSATWVAHRVAFLQQTSPYVLGEIFSGRFPASGATHALHKITRVNKTSMAETDKFVQAVTGKKLSVRNIDLLAKAYFSGGKLIKDQILKGDFSTFLSPSPQKSISPYTDDEQQLLSGLEMILKYMERIYLKILHIKGPSNNFLSMAITLVDGIEGRYDKFISTLNKTIREEGKEND